MSAALTEKRMTVDEFMAKYGDCSGVELIRGKVVFDTQPTTWTPEGGFHMPKFNHGVVCIKAAFLLGDFIRTHDLGWMASNDTFVKVSDDPPIVLSADFFYVSYRRLPKGKRPKEMNIPPDLVVEVRSPTNRWKALVTKAMDYLDAGVQAVVLLDPNTETASVFRADEVQQLYKSGDELTLPDVLPGLAVPVRQFFE